MVEKVHRGRAAARLALLLGPLVLLPLSVEGCLRLRARGGEEAFRPSAILGWEHVPGAGGYNGMGLSMDREVAPRPAPETRRVLLLGDSFLDDARFWKVLEEALRRRFPGDTWEVVNGGTTGYSPDLEYLWWHHYGRFLSADLVVVFPFLGNDWGDVAKEATNGGISKPYFLLDDGRLVLHNSPVPHPEHKGEDRWSPLVRDEWRGRLGVDRAAAVESPFQRALYRAHLALKARSVAYARLKDAVAATLHGGGVVSEAERYAPADVAYYRTYAAVFSESGPDLDRSWALVEALLDRLDEDVAASGARLAVVAIPHVWQVDSAVAARFGAAAARANLAVDLETPPRRLAAAARRLDWDYLDLLETFRSAHGETGVYDGIGPEAHWNDRGRAVAAEAICDLLDRRGLAGR